MRDRKMLKYFNIKNCYDARNREREGEKFIIDENIFFRDTFISSSQIFFAIYNLFMLLRDNRYCAIYVLSN